MAPKLFEFRSPRVEICLSHLRLLRQVANVLDDDLQREMLTFSSDLQTNLPEFIPSLGEGWTIKLEKRDIRIRPKSYNRDACGDAGIIIQAARKAGDIWKGHDPWVGIWMEELSLAHSRQVYDEVPKSADEEWGDPLDRYPLWAHVRYIDFIGPDENAPGGEAFDTTGFVKQFIHLTDKLVSLWDAVERAAVKALATT